MVITKIKLKKLEHQIKQLKRQITGGGGVIIFPDDRREDLDAYAKELEKKNGWEPGNGGLGYVFLPEKAAPPTEETK